MAGNFDDIIQQVLDDEAAKQQPQDVIRPPMPKQDPLSTYDPGPYGGKFFERFDPAEMAGQGRGVQVPPDSMRDYKYYYQDAPFTGSETTEPNRSVQSVEDDATHDRMKYILDAIGKMTAPGSPNYSHDEVTRLFNTHDALRKSSPSSMSADRYRERTTNAPKDADVIMRAIMLRAGMGRGK